jgi:hypothetical protein
MAKLYLIKDGRCLEKEGSGTRTVGKSGAIHVSQGLFDGKESYAITYNNGDVCMTTGNGTVQMKSGISNTVVSTQFYDNGLLFHHQNGKKYLKLKSSGKEIR